MAGNVESGPNVGVRLRVLREQRALSLRELARQCGLSFNAISRIERGENSPTVSTLHSLATALRVPISAFFEDASEQLTVLIRRHQRLSFDGHGISMESLGTGLRDQQLEPFQVTVAPRAGNGDGPIIHPGQEFVHCLEGCITYRVNADAYHLEAGDSLLFVATQPHSFHNAGDQAARLILVCQTDSGSSTVGQRHLDG